MQTNRNGKPNPTAETTIKFITFRGFPDFQCFRILANEANICKNCFKNVKSDNCKFLYF